MKAKNLTRLVTLGIVAFSLIFSILPKIKAQPAGRDGNGDAVFSNTAPIAINTSAPLTAPTTASLYPSIINVSGMSGTTTRVQVSLRGLSHSQLIDLDFLLVGPGGQKFIFLSDAPNTGFVSAQDAVYTFADDAPNGVPNQSAFNPGFYRPGNFGVGDTFPAPAPAAPYDSTTFANNFNGTSPNGAWSLFVVDDALGEAGSINSGWELTITTTGSAAQTFANTNYIGLEETNVRANPYPSTINVSGLSGVVSSLKVSLNGLTHTQTQDIDVLLVNPNGSSFVLMSDTGAGAANNVNLTFDDAAANNLPSNTPLVSGTFKPTDNFLGNTDFFPSPAPLRPYYNASSQLSSFNNFTPNGLWQLYVIDDTANNSGTIAGGWSLDITTVPLTPPQAGCAFPSLIPSNFAVGATPTNLASGDFNNDAKLDLVVTNQLSNDVSILLNNGAGGFAPQTNIMSGGTNPYDVAVGLFNNDNNQDFAVVNSGSNNVSIFLGNGNGTFSAPTNFITGPNPISIEVGDFNNDNRRDLAIANFGGFFSGSVSLLFGNGNGGFSFPSTLRTGTQPAFVKAVFLNNDNAQDLVVANFGANTVSVFFGDGNGAFSLSQNLSFGSPVSVEIANLPGDNNPDLIVASYNGNSLFVFSGLGNGVFSNTGFGTGFGPNPISVIAADVLGNGTNSLAVAFSGTNQIGIATSGAITNFQQYIVGANPNALIKGDFNGDGRLDLATANSSSNNVTVLTNTCIAAISNIFDFTGDRRTDFVIYRPSAGFWAIFGQGQGQPFFFGRDRDIIVPADYDGDLRTDIAVYRPENGLWFATKTSATFSPIGTILYLQFGAPADIPAPADFDEDGKADIAVFRPSNGTWYVRKSSDNSFLSAPFGQSGDRPVPADYDGDGQADFAVFRPSNGIWYVMGSQAGFFGAQFGQAGDRTVQGDYDGDGKTDFAVFRNGIFYVLRSSNGSVQAQNFGTTGDIPVPGDYEGDGRIDFAVYRPSQGIFYILRSSDGGFQATTFGLPIDVPAASAYSR